jgi:glucokinase
VNALGIDIGATNTKVALVSGSGDASAIETFRTGAGDASGLIASIREAAQRCRGDAPIRGAGVAVAGFLNPARDRLSYNPNLEWLSGFPLKEALSNTLDGSVTLEVDSNASCLGEYLFGAGRGSRRFLCLVSGTGLGGGMMIDGALLRFMGECIGDVGHVVVDRDGPECTCGGRGCAEAVAGAQAIVANAQSGATLRAVIESARRGNVHAVDALAFAGRAIGIAAASLAQIFSPDRIALAGGLAEAEDLVLDPAAAEFRRTVNADARERVVMMKASLGWRATVIGAAAPLLRNSETEEPPANDSWH